jgi:hypothetical protein
MCLIFSISLKIDQVSYFPPEHEQVSYFPQGRNNWPDPIFLTIGESLPDFLGPYWTGPVLEKSLAPKFFPLNLRSTKWGSNKLRRYCIDCLTCKLLAKHDRLTLKILHVISLRCFVHFYVRCTAINAQLSTVHPEDDVLCIKIQSGW